MSASGSVYSGDYEALKKAKGQSRLLLIALVASVLLFATFLWNTSGSAEEFSVRKVMVVRLVSVCSTITELEMGLGYRCVEGPYCGGHRVLLSKLIQGSRFYFRVSQKRLPKHGSRVSYTVRARLQLRIDSIGSNDIYAALGKRTWRRHRRMHVLRVSL
jgi:hypothetical protein